MVEQIQNNPFNRPPRVQEIFKPIEIELPSPPSPPEEGKQNLLSTLLPMSSFIIMGFFYALMFRGSSGGGGWLYAVMMIIMAVFTFLTTFIITGIQKHEQKQRWIKSLRDYHHMLDKKESRLLAARLLQLDLLEGKFCTPAKLIRRVQDLEITLWEKRPEDVDFLSIRIGKGRANSLVQIKAPDPDINNEEVRRAIAIQTEYRKIPNAPVIIDLREFGSVALIGARNQSLNLARAIIAQIISNNSPEDVRLFLFSSESCYQTWQWLRWLPHTNQSQVGGQPEFLAFTRRANKNLISQLSQLIDSIAQKKEDTSGNSLSPATIIILDKEIDIREEPVFSSILKEGKKYNIFTILISDILENVPSDFQALVSLQHESFSFSKVGLDSQTQTGTADGISLIDADNLSNRLLPIAIRTQGLNSRIPGNVNLLQAYGVNKIETLNVYQRWLRIPSKNGLLPFPIGLGSETFATPFVIHLAENLDGPHGLIAGTTGSGKSELLQTMVSALALEHHPYLLNFLLIDFKGGSTFSVFENLPHVVGLVSNLDKFTAIRALEAIKAEILQREKFLKRHDSKDINDYHKKLVDKGGITVEWDPLPHLFIIVDEFAQMAQEMPGFLPEIVATGRLGRSLGIHIILATQRPAGVVSDEMRANLNFRISLRVQSIEDSRDMLLRPDAAYLPHNLPGRAYFQLGDGGNPRQFQVARSAVEMVGTKGNNDFLHRLEFEQHFELVTPSENDSRNPTIASALVKTMVDLYQEEYYKNGFNKLEPILLEPLHAIIKISEILKPEICKWDFNVCGWKSDSNEIDFKIPIGVLDSLSTKTQPPQWIDFLHFGGHVMIVGGPQSGKTSLLQSIVFSLTTRYTPDEVHIYGLSFSGRELEVLGNLPHVGNIIQGNDNERFHRLLRFLQLQIEYRKECFGESQAQDLLNYNSNISIEKRLPNICVLIDNFGELKNTDYIDELNEFEKLIQIGRIYGLYFIITAMQSNDIPYRIANLIQTKFALNLADHTEYLSLVGRPDSMDFENLQKGRCFVSGTTPPLQCQVGMPLDKHEWKNLGEEMLIAWGNNKRPEKIGILKQLVYLSELITPDESNTPLDFLPVGIDGDTLNEFKLNLSVDNPHYLIGGTPQSGRTSLLHSIVLKLADQYSPESIKIILVDGSGKSLIKIKDLPHIVDWVKEEDGLTTNIANLESELAFRREHKEIKFTPIVFVVDDYDQLTEAISIGDEILMKLSKHIRQDSDLNFHFLITVSSDFLNTNDPLLKQIKLMRSGISLASVETLEIMGGHVTSAMRNQNSIQGRGYILSRSGSQLIQFASPDSLAYQLVTEKWKGYKRSKWDHPANEAEIKQVREESAPIIKRDRDRVGSKSSSYIDQEASIKKYLEQQMKKKKV